MLVSIITNAQFQQFIVGALATLLSSVFMKYRWNNATKEVVVLVISATGGIVAGCVQHKFVYIAGQPGASFFAAVPTVMISTRIVYVLIANKLKWVQASVNALPVPPEEVAAAKADVLQKKTLTSPA